MTTGRLSGEAVDALVARWRATWRKAPAACPSFWGRTADAYVGPGAGRTPAVDPLEAADRERWSALRPSAAETLATRSVAAARRMGRRALTAAEA